MSEDQVNRVIAKYEAAINEGKLVGVRCKDCNNVMVPPRPVCRACQSTNIEIHPIEGRGKLLTWTTIHVGPPSYEDNVPYTVGIVEFDNGERLTGIVEIPVTELDYGIEVVAGFDPSKEGAARLRWRKPE
ncbi:MAG: Zn-ribbon domain-containing OB-fold protein [Methanobacteriota archaeon]|nr:MAG: Zn-ribbon domain-containing OB-fold protein [Euryarchaeota archaeon]